LTGPLNATSTQAFETVRLLLLDRDAQATRDASPTRNRSAANGQNRRLRIPSHNTVSTISKIPRPSSRTASPPALRHRSSVRRVRALCLEDPKRSVKPLFSRWPDVTSSRLRHLCRSLAAVALLSGPGVVGAGL